MVSALVHPLMSTQTTSEPVPGVAEAADIPDWESVSRKLAPEAALRLAKVRGVPLVPWVVKLNMTVVPLLIQPNL